MRNDKKEDAKQLFSELDERYPFEPAPTFSWSSRFENALPEAKDSYTSARKHGQFKSYYGYLPSEVAANMAEGERTLRPIQPTSLPATLNRREEGTYRRGSGHYGGYQVGEATYSRAVPKSARIKVWQH